LAFKEYFGEFTIRLLANARAEVSQQKGTFGVNSESVRSFIAKTCVSCVKGGYSLRFCGEGHNTRIVLKTAT
jgi:hypothetical protein